MISISSKTVSGAALLLLAGTLLSACATTPPTCSIASEHDLEDAFASARRSLVDGCESHLDSYMERLLVIAKGDPQPSHKRRFSEFLLWAADVGLLSKRQAQERYNRYFNVKFVTLMGDYNNCSYTCPRQDRVLSGMENELADKELGLLQVSLDRDGYYRADRLFKEAELVLAATCSACGEER